MLVCQGPGHLGIATNAPALLQALFSLLSGELHRARSKSNLRACIPFWSLGSSFGLPLELRKDQVLNHLTKGYRSRYSIHTLSQANNLISNLPATRGFPAHCLVTAVCSVRLSNDVSQYSVHISFVHRSICQGLSPLMLSSEVGTCKTRTSLSTHASQIHPWSHLIAVINRPGRNVPVRRRCASHAMPQSFS